MKRRKFQDNFSAGRFHFAPSKINAQSVTISSSVYILTLWTLEQMFLIFYPLTSHQEARTRNEKKWKRSVNEKQKKRLKGKWMQTAKERKQKQPAAAIMQLLPVRPHSLVSPRTRTITGSVVKQQLALRIPTKWRKNNE